MSWLAVGIFALTFALYFVLAPRPPELRSRSFQDVEVPTANQGIPIAKVFGTYAVQGPNVVWYGDIAFEEVKSGSGGGGK